MSLPVDVIDELSSLPDAPALLERGRAGRVRLREARWLLGEGARRSPAVRRYVHFLEGAWHQVASVRRRFERTNPNATSAIDAAAAYIGRFELMHLMNLMYLQVARGVDGDFMECGAFRGASTCSLSWAAAMLGRRLHVADSFEGLPDVGQSADAFYQPGQFACDAEAFLHNLSTLGVPGVVTMIEGWFDTSLVGFDTPLAMVWLDVDLERSVEDALDGVLGALQPGGVVAFHETRPEHISAGRLVADDVPSSGARRALERAGRAYHATHLAAYTGLAAVDDGSHPPLAYDPDVLHTLVFAMQPAELANAAGRRALRWVAGTPIRGMLERVGGDPVARALHMAPLNPTFPAR